MRAQHQGDTTMKNLKVNLIRGINVEPAPQPEAAPSPALANGLICPLTRKPFTDPVIAPNGVTYNADAIYPYLKKHGHLPTDNRPITPSKIWPDQNMRDRLSTNPHRDKDEYLEDPITFDTMTNPVVASDGRTYNQSSLEILFREHNGISPFSRAQLATTGYRNQTLITELNPKVGQARTATLANAPTQNLVNFGPEAEADEIGARQAEADEIGARQAEADEIGARQAEADSFPPRRRSSIASFWSWICGEENQCFPFNDAREVVR